MKSLYILQQQLKEFSFATVKADSGTKQSAIQQDRWYILKMISSC